MSKSDLVRVLEGFADAYPVDVFPEPSKEDRDWLKRERPGLQDAIAASMGRHLGKWMLEAAAEIERLRWKLGMPEDAD